MLLLKLILHPEKLILLVEQEMLLEGMLVLEQLELALKLMRLLVVR
jgi:hypothetical protein